MFGAIAAIFSFTSCDNDSPEIKGEEVTTATDYTALLGILDLDEIDDETTDNALKSALDTDQFRCFEVTVHENETDEFWPRSWTFTYGEEGCEDFFGNTKLGSVHVTLTDFWKNEGSLRTITFDDFSINGNKQEGTRTILNTGFNDRQNLTFERSFEDASYSRADTATMTWECDRQVEMIAGYETFIARDDEYLVSGGASGINYDGNSFTVTITDDLYYKKCSFFPVSGIVTVEVDGGSSMTIDYGNGECDNIASMTLDGVTTEITLGRENRCCGNQ